MFEVPGSRKEEELEVCKPEDGLNLDFVEELPFEDGEGYISSSCSISMSSDVESSHQITVPVFIEPAPPEIRSPELDEPLLDSGDLRGLLRGDHPRVIRQETMHTDSGLDTEDICPASPTNTRFSADIPNLEDSPRPKHQGFEDESLRLVLVRDIGIQCCAESPNLSLHRRHRSADDHEPSADLEACDDFDGQRTDNLTRHLSAELLF